MSDELRSQQQFLLNSLRDLEREYEAGDIDEQDYATLREGYIARTAAITRAIESSQELEEAPSTPWRKRIITAVVVVAIGLGLGVLVARQSGQRIPGQSLSGGIEQSSSGVLASARQLNFSDPQKAIELYSQVLKIEPDNVEALTYRSWLLALASRSATGDIKKVALATAVADLLRAQKADPTYPDAHCFLGIVYYRFFNNAELSKRQLDVCVSMNPPASTKSFVDAIVADVNKALGK